MNINKMKVFHKDLIKIVENSSTIPERLENKFLLNQLLVNDHMVNSRIDNWCQTVAAGNQEKFEKRLAWDNLGLNTIRDILDSVHLTNSQHLPDWAETLKAALEATVLVSLEEKNFLNPQEPLPFEELFLPFIYVARQKLQAQSGCSYSLLSPEAHANLERYLLESLTNLCSHALGINFQIFRTYQQPTLGRWLGQLQGAHSREQYNKFINKMLSGELLTFFQEYNVLARLAATVTDFWVSNTCEFLQRLASDWSDIQTTFQSHADLGQVVAIEPSLSDLHHNGHSVIAVTFASSLKLIYKPKDLGIEEAFFQLLAWLNEKEIPQPLKQLQLLNRSNYGWVEYVEHLPCPDEQSAVRFYHRAGMLLCLLYILSGADFHQENIIACGEHPVLIDLEMLMSARPREEGNPPDAQTNALYLAFEQYSYSVLSTSFLPKWEFGRDGLAYDISGLGGTGGQQTHFRKLIWQNINTDGMVLNYEYVKTKSSSNIPILNGVHLLPSNYVEELVDGFRQMFQFLMAHKETLLAANSPLAKLAHQKVRSIFRPSQVYASLINETLQPKYLQNGVDRSIALDVLSKSFLKYESKPRNWRIIAAEQEALANLDLPLFTTYPDSADLIINSHQFIKQYFKEPSYDLVVARLRQLNKDDLEQQIGFIRSSLYTSIANEVEHPLSLSQQAALIDTTFPLTEEVLIQQAVNIAQELQKRAVRASDGSVTWMGMDYIPEAGRLQPKSMGYDFYDGSSGVAVFLAALAKITGSEEFHDLALGALKPIRNLVQNSNSVREQAIIKQIGIGGGKGLGSILYTLVRSSQFLEEPILLEDAQRLASLITATTIAADDKFDIISGTAGTILGLLAFYHATAHSPALELAKTCGYHLLNYRVVSDTGYHTWATVGGKLLTGISHGAAGIAYALLRLYAVVGDSSFLQAALEAIAYERSVFSPQAQNWLDFRGEKPGFGMTWCHGAPGIGLARLGCLAILDTAEIRQDIDTALQSTQKFCLQDIDHLCCGNFGRIDVLLVAAQKLKQPELLEIIQKHTAFLIKKAEKVGFFQVFPSHFQGLYNPGFFQGTAGIGYELLRLAYPEQLPAVLLWE